MAVPTSFDESNAVLGRPEDMTDEECAPLCVFKTKTTEGRPIIVSCWKFTADELIEIYATGRVWVGIMGTTMPPIYVTGEKPGYMGREEE